MGRAVGFIFLLVVLAAAGCGSSQQGFGENAPPAKPGAHAPLAAFWITRNGQEKPVLVNKDYGMLILWNDNEHRFFVYDNLKATVSLTTDFEEFLRRIDALPEGVTIEWEDQCCAPFSWKMAEADEQRLITMLEKGRRTTEYTVTCTCEIDSLRFPQATPREGEAK